MAPTTKHKNRNKVAQHLLIHVVERRPGTYFLPVASLPSVKAALCSPARPSLSGAPASVAHVVSDPSRAFKSAVDVSVLNPDPTGRGALGKHREKGREINKGVFLGNAEQRLSDLPVIPNGWNNWPFPVPISGSTHETAKHVMMEGGVSQHPPPSSPTLGIAPAAGEEVC